MATATATAAKRQPTRTKVHQGQDARPPSLIQKFSTFTRTAAGLEKTLRLINATCQIAGGLSGDVVTASRWGVARGQLALTRRYFRFFNVIDCFARVADLLPGGNGRASEAGSVMALLELARWTCLGMYLLLEDATILHATNIYPVSWNARVTTEAYRFWFCGLALSVLGCVWGVLLGIITSPSSSTSPSSNKASSNGSSSEKKAGKERGPVAQVPRSVLVKRIVVDGCDLLIPGAFLGWIRVGELGVGVAMLVSTLVAGRDLWMSITST
ncbi:peroxisomal biogenesis factor 11 [Aspergillus taichungensis]|uniref:Peroxisomal biogenesis factor 11 n=1 Tax=Aspergillus taichungensis TaxID=482145 RepID=A0A2J5HWD8_9EURO|nr:peroxisomal biogenesis factor 11 [Aspergillus taichungensis]